MKIRSAMKRRCMLLVFTLLPAGGIQAKPQDTLQQRLIATEKRSWEAWKNMDAGFFRLFLSEDHMDVGGYGVLSKTEVLKSIEQKVCAVSSYEVSDFRFARLSGDTAVLTYRAKQDTKCGGNAVPSPVRVTSVYVRRNGKWLNAVFQQSR